MKQSQRAAISSRFEALSILQEGIKTYRADSGYIFAEQRSFQKWAVSALSLLNDIFGENSVYLKSFSKAYDENEYNEQHVQAMIGIFESARHDFENGFFSPEILISGEVLGDFIGLAKIALAESRKDVAAVLACAALEDALKRFALSRGLQVEGKDLEMVINALKKSGDVQGFDKKFLETTPRTRNAAMHADWNKLTPELVSTVIGFVDQFLLEKFHQG